MVNNTTWEIYSGVLSKRNQNKISVFFALNLNLINFTARPNSTKIYLLWEKGIKNHEEAK
jgi:hypothetical protein